MHNDKLSRRKLLQGGAAVAGALAWSSSPARRFGSLFGDAQALGVTDQPALMLIFLRGGYNALFCSADSFVSAGTFGVTASNVMNVGNGVVIDKGTFGTMPATALANMAAIGVNHGLSAHSSAQMAVWNMGSRSYPIMLASALGGTAAIRCATVGSSLPNGTLPPEGGVSMQRITDMASTISSLGGATPDPTMPDRTIASKGLIAAQAMSSAQLTANAVSLKTTSEGYATAIDMLQKPVQQFNFPSMAQAYGLAANTSAVSSFTSQMLAAELMVLAGANVVVASTGGWDTHGDRSGSVVRTKMTSQIMPGLNAFLSRMLAAPGRNVVTVIFGEFSRSLPGSDHQHNLTATVIGKHVKQGTTGHVSANVALPAGSPSVAGLWSYLATVLQAQNNPFGSNPHPLVV
jgi:uncharacterized protein (DUF1501 family)